MSKTVTEQINYWPGYVDALVNVVLNLLFLVGVFTIGLVALNMEAIFTQEKMMRLQIENSFEGELNAERQQKALELLAQRANAPPHPKKVSPPVEPVTPDVVREVHLKTPREPLLNKTEVPTLTPEQIALSLSGGTDVLAKLTFDKDQFNWPNDAALPARLSQENISQPVLVMVVTDTTNPRLAHEAYTRLVAVRSAMLRQGVDPKNIRLRAFSHSPALVRPTDIELAVFVVRVSP